MQPNTRQDKYSQLPSSDVAVASKLHARGLVQPGSAHVGAAFTKNKKAPRSQVKRPEAKARGFRVSAEKGERESREKKQSMGSGFIFELDKIRKIPNENEFLTNESSDNPDECITYCVSTCWAEQEKAAQLGRLFTSFFAKS